MAQDIAFSEEATSVGVVEMTSRFAHFDWTATPLGPAELWPQSLRTTVDLMLAMPQPASICWGPELRFLYNDDYIPILGDKHPGALGRPLCEVWSECADGLQPAIEGILAGEPQRFVDAEFALSGNGPDVRSRWFTVTWTPLRDDDGAVVGFLGVGTETTKRVLVERALELSDIIASSHSDAQERARAETALRMSEENFRSIANVVPDLLWYSEPDGSTTWYNERWVEYTGQTLEHILRWGWIDVVHPEDREVSVRRYQKAVEAGSPLHREHRIRRHDGEYRWFLVRVEPLRAEGGRLIGMYGAATDIHQERLARQKLEARVARRTEQLASAVEDFRQSEDRLRLLMEQMPAILWTTDFDLRVATLVGAIPRAMNMPELPPNSRAVGDVFIDTDGDNAAVTVHENALFRQAGEFEFHVDSKIYEAHVEPLRDEEGRTIGTIGVAHDVTDRTLRALQKSFISSVSHDLQTPLTSIRAGLGLLEASIGEKLEPAERKLLEVSRRNTERLRLQIERLLAANQLTSGSTIATSAAAVDLVQMAEIAMETIRPLLQEKKQEVSLDMPQRLEVAGDQRLLEQVLANLLSNASRHTQSGAQIVISGWFIDSDVWLAVHDTGPGIPADQIETIFQRFHRAPGDQREGIGLGLAIARDAVEAQGGRIWAESQDGKGTTFFVVLPRAPWKDEL